MAVLESQLTVYSVDLLQRPLRIEELPKEFRRLNAAKHYYTDAVIGDLRVRAFNVQAHLSHPTISKNVQESAEVFICGDARKY